MLDPKKSRYLYLMLAGFGAIAMSLILFFFLFRLRGIGDAIRTLGDIMAPFIYGGVMAYLLCPLCNCYESFFRDLIPRRYHNAVGPIAVALSLITGLLLVYALIIMIAPSCITVFCLCGILCRIRSTSLPSGLQPPSVRMKRCCSISIPAIMPSILSCQTGSKILWFPASAASSAVWAAV